MGTIKIERPEPEAVFYSTDLDTALIQELSKNCLVIVEKRENDIKIELHNLITNE